MFSLILIFYFILYPYLLFAFFNKKYKNYIIDNTSLTSLPDNIYNIYIISSQDQNINPYYKNNEYNIKVIFEIPDNSDIDILENKIKYFNTKPCIYLNYLSLNLNITEENKNYIENISKYIKYLYPTYSKIIFVYYESLPFISQLLRKNINIMNNDTTRNYFMVNIKSLLYKFNETKKIIDFFDIDQNLKLLQSDINKYNEKYQESVDPFVIEYLELKENLTDDNYLYEELI